MTQKLVVTVDATEGGPELATVQDVLMHVLELFQLVTESDPANEGKIAWRLVNASMNSPFTIVAEAIPRQPYVPVDDIAASQVKAFVSNYHELQQGRIPVDWSTGAPRQTVTRLFTRSRQFFNFASVKSTDGPQVDDVEITPTIATQIAVTAAPAVAAPVIAKTQAGSIEGMLVEIKRYYDKPAIQITERKTNQPVWCVISEEFQHEISESTKLEDVWKGSRVLVKGLIHYASDGRISRVTATQVKRIEPAFVADEAIIDKEFTGGLSVSEYLEKFRDGKLG